MNANSQLDDLQVLIDCLRDVTNARPRSEGAPRILDPNQLVSLARRHRLVPMLFQWLSDRHDAPAELKSMLRYEAHLLVGRNLRLTQELVRVGEEFRGLGISFLPLKGPVLAQAVYGGLGSRPFGDLDILVKPEQLWPAFKALQAMGYECEFDWPAWRHRAYSLSSGHHYAFFHPQRGMGVELHWRVSPGKLSFPIETPEFWQRLETVELAGSRIPCSPPEDLLLILCIHGARHWWSQLNLIGDVALLLKRFPNLDWSAVRKRAEAVGALRTLHLGLLMASKVLEAELPASLKEEIVRDHTARALADDSWSLLVLQTDLEEEHWQRWRYYLRLRERPLDRLIYAGGQGINSLFWRNTSWAMDRQRARKAALAPARAEMVAE